MIGTVWNICRACPSMPLGSVEKFHSEYRSTFQWHEPAKQSQPAAAKPSTAIVLQQPYTYPARNLHLQSLQTGDSGEPPIPRRKKHPDPAYAYRTNEWITRSEGPTTTQLRATEVKEKVHLRPKKSMSMGTIPGQAVQVRSHRRRAPFQDSGMERGGGGDVMSESREDEQPKSVTFFAEESTGTMHESDGAKNLSKESGNAAMNRKEYKSEYKERFRPFSQYEYVDGRFLNRREDHDSERPWYTEVIELRKKAGEYKFRGWGTDLCSPTVHAFNQQLWEQVARRSSLAPLSLMTPAPRYEATRADSEKENTRKSFTAPKTTFGRPHTATPKHPLSDTEERHRSHKDGEVAHKKKLLDESNATKKLFPKMKARSQSAGPPSRSPRKPTSSTTTSSFGEKDGGGAGWKVQNDAISAGTRFTSSQKHLRPTTLTTSPGSRASDKKNREAMARLANKQLFKKSSADPSFGHGDVPPVKSPPEPTRMKSPEQALVHSPDPVNWTVPLDTTKGFTVTQNIKAAPPSPRKLPGHGNEPKSSKPVTFSQTRKKQEAAVNGFKSTSKPAEKNVTVAQTHPGPAAKVPPKPASADEKKKPEASKYQKPIGEIKPQTGAPIRCLEDPTFMFDSAKSKSAGGESGLKSQLKGVRVLEAPVEVAPNKTVTEAVVPSIPPPAVSSSQPAATGSKVSGTPPKTKKGVSVLEAPTEGAAAQKASGRSKASDVLEKAKHKFDKFWGKSKDEGSKKEDEEK